jgi:glucosylglycerate hydrolase
MITPDQTMTLEEVTSIGWRAAEVLRRNDFGTWTKPAPNLYPHQWSWDSAFIAIGLSHLDTCRAAQELGTLLDAQWKTGKIPHIVFNPNAPLSGYFPGPGRWKCNSISADAPARVHTTALCQPPVHAIAAKRIFEAAQGEDTEEEASFARAFLEDIYPSLFAWHRYLATYRDPEGSGLVTIYHPWESGTDNSPRWDSALAAVEPKEDVLAPYLRCDLQHVEDPSERPTAAEYDHYLWLLESLKQARYDEAAIYQSHPFLIKDVLFSAILVAANEALLEISEIVKAPDKEREFIAGWIRRGRCGLEECWEPSLKLCVDYDVRAQAPIRTRTVAGFAPLVAGGLATERLQALLERLDSVEFGGNEELCWSSLVPSTSPEEEGFHSRSYWRGPSWPVTDWLMWWSLSRAGEKERAGKIKKASLERIARGGFAEYFEPYTGEALGSADQSWTAAVALDWLAEENRGFTRQRIAGRGRYGLDMMRRVCVRLSVPRARSLPA